MRSFKAFMARALRPGVLRSLDGRAVDVHRLDDWPAAALRALDDRENEALRWLEEQPRSLDVHSQIERECLNAGRRGDKDWVRRYSS